VREREFSGCWKQFGNGQEPEQQFRFFPGRQWKFDFAWPKKKVAVEIDGGTFGRVVKCHSCEQQVRHRKKDGSLGQVVRIGGGHNHGDALLTQYAKQNAALLRGWLVLRYHAKDLDRRPVQMVEEITLALIGRENAE